MGEYTFVLQLNFIDDALPLTYTGQQRQNTDGDSDHIIPAFELLQCRGRTDRVGRARYRLT